MTIAGIRLLACSPLAEALAAEPDGNTELAKQWANKAKDRLDSGDFQGALDAMPKCVCNSVV